MYHKNKLATPFTIKVTKAGTHDLIAVKSDLLNIKDSLGVRFF